jgi:hypothetical protein
LSTESTIPAATRGPGAIVVVASVASVLLMAHHPSVRSHDAAAVVAELAQKARADQVVHGALIALTGALVFGFLELGPALGRRATARAALVAYAAGSAGMIGAALVSGFLVPALAARYEAASGPALDVLPHLLGLAALANRTLAGFGVAATSGAILLWSVALLRRPCDFHRATGFLGLASGGAPLAALLLGAQRLDVRGMTLVVVAQAAWSVAVGAQMFRGFPSPDPHARPPGSRAR